MEKEEVGGDGMEGDLLSARKTLNFLSGPHRASEACAGTLCGTSDRGVGTLSSQPRNQRALPRAPLVLSGSQTEHPATNKIQNGPGKVLSEWPEVLWHTLAHPSSVYRLTGLPEMNLCRPVGSEKMARVTLSFCLSALLR